MVAEVTELLPVAHSRCSWIGVTAFTVFSCRPDVTVLNVVASIQRGGLKYRRFAPA
jgi:hypothetical protein